MSTKIVYNKLHERVYMLYYNMQCVQAWFLIFFGVKIPPRYCGISYPGVFVLLMPICSG